MNSVGLLRTRILLSLSLFLISLTGWGQPAVLPVCHIRGASILCLQAIGAPYVNYDTLTGDVAPLDPNYNYTWSISTGTNAVIATPTFNVSSVKVNPVNSGGLFTIQLSIVSKDGSVTVPSCSQTVTVEHLTDSLSITNVSCNGKSDGSVILTPYSGVAPISYLWSNGAHTQNLVGVPAGTYSVTFIDQTACPRFDTAIVTEPDPLVCYLQLAPIVPQCNIRDTVINGLIWGGTGPYTCTSASFDSTARAAGWAVTSCSVSGTNIRITYHNHDSLSAILTVTVTDKNGCQSTCTGILTCREQEPCVPDFREHHRNFWEEHSHLWSSYHDPVVKRMAAGVKFVTRTDFYTYFNVPASRLNLSSRPMLTMLEALSLRRSSSCASLAREGITALLDAAVLGDRYPFPPGTWDFTSLYFAIRNNLYNGTFDHLACVLRNIDDTLHQCDHYNHWHSPMDLAENVLSAPVDDVVAKNAETGSSGINVFPNPFDGQVTFLVTPEETGRARLDILDVYGRHLAVIYDGNVTQGVPVNLTYTAPRKTGGVLIYRLLLNGKVYTGKLWPLGNN